MWGYDLQYSAPCNSAVLDSGEHLNNKSEKTISTTQLPQEDFPRFKSCTRGGKAKEFVWCFDANADSIKIDRGFGNPDYFKAEVLFSVIHDLYDYFGSDWYPLANNVEKMSGGTEIRGLGSSIYSITKNTTNAMAASQLGVILEKLGIFEWNNKVKGIAWRLCVEPPTTIDDLRMALLSEPALNAVR